MDSSKIVTIEKYAYDRDDPDDERIRRAHTFPSLERVESVLAERVNSFSGVQADFELDRIVLDLETTGLEPERDEILSVSIVDGEGHVLLNRFYKPVGISEWPDAERVHGISPRDVVNRPRISDDVELIRSIIGSAREVCIYNAPFDLGFLEASGVCIGEEQVVTDVMVEYADLFHEGRWTKLTDAVLYVNGVKSYDLFSWSTQGAHTSLGDCLATLFVHDYVLDHLDPRAIGRGPKSKSRKVARKTPHR